jgi:hypothetical protein
VVGGERGHEAQHPLAPAHLGDPALQLAPEVRVVAGRVRRALRLAQRDQERRTDQERGRVDRHRGAGAEDHDQRARHCRAEHVAGVLRQPDQRVRLLQLGGRHQRGGEAARGRAEERLERAVERRQRDQVPELGAAAQQQRGGDRLDDRATDVGDQHQAAARDPVGPHARGKDQERHRQHLRREHQAELARGAVEPVEHRERERDRQQRVAEHGHRLAREQQAEVAVTEDGDVAHGRGARPRTNCPWEPRPGRG